MAKVKFPGVDEDITAPNTPWIYYGVRFRSCLSSFTGSKYAIVGQGSYAGARAAHMKILYPELVYGAIASSGRRTHT